MKALKDFVYKHMDDDESKQSFVKRWTIKLAMMLYIILQRATIKRQSKIIKKLNMEK